MSQFDSTAGRMDPSRAVPSDVPVEGDEPQAPRSRYLERFGINAGWHHLTSLLFHVANTILLFLVLKKMTRLRPEAAAPVKPGSTRQAALPRRSELATILRTRARASSMTWSDSVAGRSGPRFR